MDGVDGVDTADGRRGVDEEVKRFRGSAWSLGSAGNGLGGVGREKTGYGREAWDMTKMRRGIRIA